MTLDKALAAHMPHAYNEAAGSDNVVSIKLAGDTIYAELFRYTIHSTGALAVELNGVAQMIPPNAIETFISALAASRWYERRLELAQALAAQDPLLHNPAPGHWLVECS